VNKSKLNPVPDTSAALLAPFSQEAEEAVIGSVLISPSTFSTLQGILKGEYFYLTRHRHIWEIFLRLSARGDVMDLTTISEELRQKGVLEEIGGYAYLIHLINNTPNSMHAEAYAKLVERTATRRKLLQAADKIREAAMDEGKHIDQVLAESEGALAEVQNSYAVLTEPVSMKASVKAFAADLQRAVKLHKANPNYFIGVCLGLDDLDMQLDGLRAGITTVAGATGMGKSAFVLTAALNASQKGIRRESQRAAKTLLFSGEMTHQQLMNRFVSSKTGIPVRNIERGNITATELKQLSAACIDLEDNHTMSFESLKRLNTMQIRQRVRSLVAYDDLDMLILDGLLQIDDLAIDPRMSKGQKSYADAKRRDAIENIMNDLEDIGLTYNLPILLTHQISRAPSTRQNKRPQLSDMAEASFVEQKSAVILFLYREAYYEPVCENPNGSEVIVAKNRHGEPGTIRAYYNRQFTRFENADVERHSFTD
jgi:replicative DNA helicase